MNPRSSKMSSGRFRERFCKDFRGINKQRDATETLPPQTARRRPRSGRARAYAIVRACCLHPREALATLALLLFVVLSLLLLLFLLLFLPSPCLQCLHALQPHALPVP